MKIPVYFEGRAVGELQLSENGLYMNVELHCENCMCVVRCVLVGEKEISMGIPMPENGEMRLFKRIARSSLGDMSKITHSELRHISQEKITETGRNVRHFEFPLDCNAPLPNMEYFCFFRLIMRSGRKYVCLDLNASGIPVINPPNVNID